MLIRLHRHAVNLLLDVFHLRSAVPGKDDVERRLHAKGFAQVYGSFEFGEFVSDVLAQERHLGLLTRVIPG